MCEACIQNFLNKSDPNSVERHPDTSDFEAPARPVITPKDGNHKLLKKKVRKCKAERDYDIEILRGNTKHYEKHSTKHSIQPLSKNKTYKDDLMKNINLNPNAERLENTKTSAKTENKGNHGDQNLCLESNSRFLVKSKILPCLSTIFRRSHNPDNLNNIEDHHNNKVRIRNKLHRDCKVRAKKRSYNYETQPVYAVRESYNISCLLNSIKSKGSLNTCSTLSSISAFEEEVKNYKYEKKLQDITTNSINNSKEHNKSEKTLRIEHDKSKEYPNTINSQRGRPYHIFTSSCQTDECKNAKCVSTDSTLWKLDANSSAFWNFLIGKVQKKCPTPNIDSSKVCNCIKPEPCNNNTCEYKNTSIGTDISYQPELTSQSQHKIPKTPLKTPKGSSGILKGSGLSLKSFKKETKSADCQCPDTPQNKENFQTPSNFKTPQSSHEKKPCQEDHDMIIKEVAAKYNGEILCIHNPPCILINGCINLPENQNVTQALYCPITQSKKSNFAQMCKKMKRSKQKCSEQGSQYHPPYSEIEQCLPEFKIDKNIQSACNHNPTCQYVHGCYKPRFSPQPTNLCTHMPMCETQPDCEIEEKRSKNQKASTKNPKCKENVCSEKPIPAKESTGTQATFGTCQHDPPCVKIPSCLAELISMHSPFEIVPSLQSRGGEISIYFQKSVNDKVTPPSNRPPSAACRIV